jgi:predicted aldo/keto reductase-like oxidoreductase
MQMKNKKRKKIDRRTFLKTTGIGSATLALSAGLAGNVFASEAAGDISSKKMPTRVLGKTGVSVSILGMGGSIDTTGYQLLLRLGLNLGINYWDSSHNYGNGKNEEIIGRFFSKYPEERKKVFQVTKASRTTEPGEMTKQLNLSLERMQTDYIDLYFIHMLQDPDRLTPEMRSWVERKKKEGKIRFFGFSCHANMARMLARASELGWIDAVMSSYSYQLMDNDDMQRAIDACVKANIGLVAMKAQGQRMGPPPSMPQGERGRISGSEGPLQGDNGQPMGPSAGMEAQTQAREPEDLSAMTHFMDKGYTLEQAKLKLVWEDQRITTCVSEMTNVTMLKDNVAAAVDGVKLSGRDREMLNRLALFNRSLYCQGCISCESAMGQESRIPDVLRYLMYYNSYGKRDDARRLFRELPRELRSGLASRDYSPAELACPNRIKIGMAMREAVRILG